MRGNPNKCLKVVTWRPNSGAGREPREIFSEADGPDFSENERKFRVGYSLWEGLRARGYGAIEK